MVSVPMALYLFLAGAGAGLSLWAFCLDCALLRKSSEELGAKLTVASSLSLGFVAVGLGALLLWAELGRSDRVLGLFFYPQPNVMSFGFFALLAFLVSSAFQLALRVVFNLRVPVWVVAAVRWFCALSATAVVLYTGFLLRSWVGVEFWGSLFLPLLFAVSGLSSGLAVFSLTSVVVEQISGGPCRVDGGLR